MGDTDIYIAALKLFQTFNPEQNLRLLETLGRTMISQEQFCQIIGRFTALPGFTGITDERIAESYPG